MIGILESVSARRGGPVFRLAAVPRRVLAWWAHRRAMAHLATQPDYLLDDIGVTRADIAETMPFPWRQGR